MGEQNIYFFPCHSITKKSAELAAHFVKNLKDTLETELKSETPKGMTNWANPCTLST